MYYPPYLGIDIVILLPYVFICGQNDGTGHGLGTYKTKGCYAYNNNGKNPGYVYFSAGGTPSPGPCCPSAPLCLDWKVARTA